jgi:hypothetical protein
MYTLEAILERLRAYKPELQRKYPVSRLGVFGSYARGEASENSDIDVAVELNGPMGLNFVAMANEIEDLFGIKVDVVPKRSIKPSYLPSVEKDILCLNLHLRSLSIQYSDYRGSRESTSGGCQK